MRIAIACCGLEHVRRGYESFSRELYDALSAQADVVLFKGSGKRSSREIVVPCLRRDFLVRFLSPGRAFYYEQITFALMLLPYLLMKKIDVLHYSEGNLGNALARFIRWTGLKVTLVQSNGGPYHPIHFRPEVIIHQVCKDGLDQALAYGINSDRMFLIPYGINPERLKANGDKGTYRDRFGLPRNKFIILSLAALNKEHKRLDYLIREVAALEDDSLYLCMAGEPTSETGELEQFAAECLPGRHRFLTVPRVRVPELFKAADLFVHSALHEGFGMVLIEACAAGVPVMCHNSAHFQWVLGEAGIYADMSVAGNLSSLIRNTVCDDKLLTRHRKLGVDRVKQSYSWEVLVPQYKAMYESLS
jgi:glycosyltransferase involved in cell wall biosynthesis